MAIKTKRQAINSIKIRVRDVDGEQKNFFDVYLGTNELTKRPCRLFSNSRAELLSKIDDFYNKRDVAGDFASELTADEILDAKNAILTLRKARMMISLTECAKREVRRFEAVSVHDKEIREAFNEYITTISGKNKKKAMSITGKWVMSVGGNEMMSQVTTKSLAEYLNTTYSGMKPKTYNSAISYIRTFLNWCASENQRYIADNPAKSIPLKAEEWEEPEFMSTEDARKLIFALWDNKQEYPDCFALTINGLMMGIRREESIRMATDAKAITVNLEDETVRVSKPKGYTKGITPRSFQMPAMAVAWAKAFDYHAGVAKISEYTTKVISRIARENQIPLPKNGFRHTFITKHIAAYGDPAKTQAIVGTSDRMRANNYCGLDSRKEGEAFFSIYPPSIS